MEENTAEKTPVSGRSRRRRSSYESNSPTPLADPQVGDIVWGKVTNSRWWPGILVTREHLGKLGSVAGGNNRMLYVYWFGDGRVSPVAKSKLIDFRKGYKIFNKSPRGICFNNGVLRAIHEFGKLQGLDGAEFVKNAASWAEEGFPLTHDTIRKPGFLSEYVLTKLKTLGEKYISDDDETLKLSIPEIDLFNSIRDGDEDLSKVCLACVTNLAEDELIDHPIFAGSICKQCLKTFCQCAFAIGSDLVSFYCCICMKKGELMVCSQPECFRAYCFTCIEMKATRGVLEIIKEADWWDCFLCEPYKEEMHGFLRPKTTDWKLNMWKIFHYNAFSCELHTIDMNILCLGETCDTVLSVVSILLSLKMKVHTLLLCGFSTEDSKKLKSKVPGQTKIEQVPSVSGVQKFEKLSVTPIHMIISSSAEKESEHLWQSFIDFYCVLSQVRIVNKLSPQTSMLPAFFLLEVSPPFKKEYDVRITRFLEIEPASWGDRDTLVWTNHPEIWKFMKGSGLPNTRTPVGQMKRKLTVRVTRSMAKKRS